MKVDKDGNVRTSVILPATLLISLKHLAADTNSTIRKTMWRILNEGIAREQKK